MFHLVHHCERQGDTVSHYPADCIGRHASKLLEGETVFAPGEPEVKGTVHIVNGVPYVHWEDEPSDKLGRLRGMVHTLRREGDPAPICRS